MALFFRGETRKFFLILLGGCRSEKNCAGFGRELREFSRGVVGGGWGRSGWVGACVEMAGDELDAGRGRGRGRPRTVRQGFGPGNGGVLTHGMHSVRIGCGLGMSTMPGLSAELVITLTVRSHRVSSRAGAGCPHLDLFAAQADADAHRRNPQRDESMPAGDIHTAASLPRRCDVRPHLPDAQGRESIRLQDIHMSVRPWCKPLGSRMRRPVRVWISPRTDTQNAVNFDGE